MRIAFFAPHKAITHPTPSGDVMIGQGLFSYLKDNGHDIRLISSFRLRNITLNPKKWIPLFFETKKTLNKVKEFKPDLFLTYHSYYKSPDIIGYYICSKLNIPYIIYQGVYATKYRRNFKTRLGFEINKKALLRADHVFANKKIDLKNLKRIIPQNKLTKTQVGINTSLFEPYSNRDLKEKLNISNEKIIISTAMLRADVKSKSISDLIDTFELVLRKEPKVKLIIAGDGENRSILESKAKKISKNIIFVGKIKRSKLISYYSIADIFAYPGIGEALGMVYLEAQCAGLPAVAYKTRGPLETIIPNQTGLLSNEGDKLALSNNILTLLQDDKLRTKIGKAARKHILTSFDINQNLVEVEKTISKVVANSSICLK